MEILAIRACPLAQARDQIARERALVPGVFHFQNAIALLNSIGVELAQLTIAYVLGHNAQHFVLVRQAVAIGLNCGKHTKTCTIVI